jgi:hypothetical protein
MSQHVASNEFSVLLVVSYGMRPRTHQAHATLQYIDELRQLIKAVPAQEHAQARDAPVTTGRLMDGWPILGHVHGPEFVDDELLAVEPVAALFENCRAARSDPDRDCEAEQ